MFFENFVNQELFEGYKSSLKATQQINLKINESDLRLIDEKAKRYGLTRSSLIKLFAINGELSINIDRNNLQRPVT
jgi:predicted DNA binding CopG/RHH family protein